MPFHSINQSINQSKHISIAPYVASESETLGRYDAPVSDESNMRDQLFLQGYHYSYSEFVVNSALFLRMG